MEFDNKVKRNIVITGFGPFGIHRVNASWEAVKLLKEKSEKKLQELYNVNLVIEELPVIYEDVLLRIPHIWKDYDPLLVIHVGVSYKAKCLTLETKASSHGYKKKDITEKCPIEIDSNEITTLQCINVGLNIDKICKKLSEEHSILISDNAGRYLCEFTFYQSLSINPNRALFVHVPDFHVYPCQTTEKELFNLICCTLETLEDESAIMSTH